MCGPEKKRMVELQEAQSQEERTVGLENLLSKDGEFNLGLSNYQCTHHQRKNVCRGFWGYCESKDRDLSIIRTNN
jgi:hypothetical protein